MVFYLKMCDSSQGKFLSLMYLYHVQFLVFNISSVFGNGYFSTSFLISGKTDFSSAIKSSKNLQRDVAAWWAM